MLAILYTTKIKYYGVYRRLINRSKFYLYYRQVVLLPRLSCVLSNINRFFPPPLYAMDKLSRSLRTLLTASSGFVMSYCAVSYCINVNFTARNLICERVSLHESLLHP